MMANQIIGITKQIMPMMIVLRRDPFKTSLTRIKKRVAQINDQNLSKINVKVRNQEKIKFYSTKMLGLSQLSKVKSKFFFRTHLLIRNSLRHLQSNMVK